MAAGGGAVGSTVFAAKAWPPAVCGLLLGLMQLPAAATFTDSLGSATAYTCVVSQVQHMAFTSLGRAIAARPPARPSS